MPERVRKRLGRRVQHGVESSVGGSRHVHRVVVDEEDVLGTNAEAPAHRVEGLTHGLDDAGRARALGELQETVAAHDSPDGVLFGTSAWLITARRA